MRDREEQNVRETVVRHRIRDKIREIDWKCAAAMSEREKFEVRQSVGRNLVRIKDKVRQE